MSRKRTTHHHPPKSKIICQPCIQINKQANRNKKKKTDSDYLSPAFSKYMYQYVGSCLYEV